ncbi:PucR family transcriptional regulator [Cellulosimicrobium funkei]|nr:PucR family transcriptional regulator [Cellulosimicrobium funkei]
MTNERNVETYRTVRPEQNALTVRQIISLPEFVMARPEIVAGTAGLEEPVRWVHVLETDVVAPFVSGHELVLSTGRGWPPDAELGAYAESLASADIAGLAIELGTRFHHVPQNLKDACNAQGIPLIALHAPTKFVAITEAVHRHILGIQLEALRTRDLIHARFAELIRNGAPHEHVVQVAASLLGAPLILEDLAHRLVVFAANGDSTENQLRDWRTRSRIAHERGNTSRLVVPVEARRHRWGYLVTLEGHPQPHDAELILGQAAQALSLELLAGHGIDPWPRVRHTRLLETLLERRVASWDDVEQRLEASGFPVHQRKLMGIAIRLQRSQATDPGNESKDVFNAVVDAADGLGVDVLCARLPLAPSFLIVALSLRANTPNPDSLVDDFISRCQRHIGGRLASAGLLGSDVPGLADSLDEAVQLLTVAISSGGTSEAVVRRTSDRELPMLLHNLHSDPRSQSFVDRILGPLISSDAQHGTDLLQVLAAFLDYPGNRTLAAAQSHLSRSVFYQRLTTIENRLGYQLNDGARIATLHAALIIYRQSKT